MCSSDLFDVLGASRPPLTVPEPLGEEPLIVRNLRDTLAGISGAESLPPERLQEAWNDALKFRDDALAAFRLGYMSLPQRAMAEQLTAACNATIARRLEQLPSGTPVPEELERLRASQAGTYYANLSVFRSAPDT